MGFINNSSTIPNQNLRIIICRVDMGEELNQGVHSVNFKEISKAVFLIATAVGRDSHFLNFMLYSHECFRYYFECVKNFTIISENEQTG